MSKFPFSYQHDSMQCGVSCLQMICKYYGKDYSLETLSNYCFATTEGVSLLGISEAADKLGLHTSCGRTTTSQLSKISLPCIIHWGQLHFVILYKITKSKFFIADPVIGLITYNLDEFEEHWISTQSKSEEKGIFMSLKPTPNFYNHKENSHPQKRSFKFLFSYVKQYKNYFFQIALGLLLGCIFQLIFPFLTQAIVDIGIIHENIKFIYIILLAQLMLVFSQTTVDFTRRWILLHIGIRINISIVSDFFIKLLKLPMSFFDTKLMGDLLERMNDHKRVEEFLTSNVLTVMFSFVSFIVLSSVLFIYNTNIFIVFIIGSILYGIWLLFFLKKRKLLDYNLFEKQAINSNKTFQFITTIQEIKLQNCEQRRRWEWEDSQADLFDVRLKVLKLQQTQEAGSIFINQIKNIIVTILAATAVIEGQITFGMMLAIQYIIGQLNSPVDQLMSFLYSLQDVRIGLERINEIHNLKNENDGNKIQMINSEPCSLLFDNVSFKYDPHSIKKTLKNISINIPQGKVTAIVGSSGSGKTTMIKLLLGYYQIKDGEIRIGSTNINNIDLKYWRKQCGVVMQDGVIFSESIARNIAIDDDSIDRDRLLNASKVACIYEFIDSLPLKFNTLIGRDGVGLSQGQKQRILIARAVYKNPKYIFLDEATNSLDASNERTIVENLADFYHGRTVILVAHRLSTVKNADKIIVIEAGCIVEEGNHSSLINKQGAYYNLVKNQLELGN